MRTLISGMLPLVLAGGCSRIQTFRVVDAKTGQPLDGVRAERLEGSIRPSSMPFVLFDQVAPIETKNTDATGAVAFQQPGQKFMINPSSKDPSHNQAYVVATHSGAKIIYPAEHREFTVQARDGVVEIPLESRILDLSGNEKKKKTGDDEFKEAFKEHHIK